MEDVVSRGLFNRLDHLTLSVSWLFPIEMQQFHFVSEMSMVGFTLFLIAFQSSSGVQMLDGPLLNGATWFAVTAETSTLVQPTPCFITSDSVSQCRRKRGIEERPIIIRNDNWDFAPSAVIG
jgi:hypothetical protein